MFSYIQRTQISRSICTFTTHHSAPRLILFGKHVAQVAAGRYHSMALTGFGACYSWGCGESGQLGHRGDDNVLFPKVVEANLGTVTGLVSCGEHHTAVLTSTPWAKCAASVRDWLHAEQEEYNIKLRRTKAMNQVGSMNHVHTQCCQSLLALPFHYLPCLSITCPAFRLPCLSIALPFH
jgi:alpha-tubulin suppressor-like RCC1 family protein